MAGKAKKCVPEAHFPARKGVWSEGHGCDLAMKFRD